jgi:hypothetical protein
MTPLATGIIMVILLFIALAIYFHKIGIEMDTLDNFTGTIGMSLAIMLFIKFVILGITGVMI